MQHHLGIDGDGDAITSCCVERATIVKLKPQPRGSQQRPAFNAIKTLLKNGNACGKAEALAHTPCVEVAKAIDEIVKELASVSPNKRKNRAARIISDLSNAGFISTCVDINSGVGWVWIDDDT